MRRACLSLALILAAGAAQAQARSWIDGVGPLVPQGYVAGTASRTDRATMTGTLAVFPAGADDPKIPGSTFEPGHVLVVTLEQRGDALVGVSATLRPRTADDRLDRDPTDPGNRSAEYMAEREAANRAVAARAADLPEGTVPCDFRAWSIDRDPKGLNVRAEPSARARVLGTLPPPFRFMGRSEAIVQPNSWFTEFNVLGWKDGWFLIEGATPPGQAYEREVYPRKHPKPYPGRGWVHGSKIGAHYANGQTRSGGLFQAPHAEARWTPAKTKGGHAIGPDGSPKRILACSGLWGLVESHDGVTGWWRGFCSSQVAICS